MNFCRKRNNNNFQDIFKPSILETNKTCVDVNLNNTVLMHKRNEILQTEDKNNDLLSSKLDFNFLLKLETTKILCIAH